MTSPPDLNNRESSPTPRLSLAPVHNCLNSLALLAGAAHSAMHLPWIRETVSAMTPEQRDTNQLLFEGFGDALFPDEEWHSVPAFVERLVARDPGELRSEIARRLELRKPDNRAVEVGPAAVWARTKQGALPVELLDDPPRLQDTIVRHLSAMWQGFLEDEWERVTPILETLLPTFRRQSASASTPSEMAGALIGPDAGFLSDTDSKQVVFVLSPHMVRSTPGPGGDRSRYRAVESEAVHWIFFGPPMHPSLFRQTPVGETELLVRLRALADPTCLHILALLSQHDPIELSAQEIMAELDLTQPTASRHLKQLSTGGYVMERRHGGASKRYRLVPGHIGHTFQALERWVSDPQGETVERETGVAPELARFLDRQGRLTSWPAKRRDQMLVLAYLVSHLEPGRTYSEPEVNALLNRWHTWGDHAKLRRTLFDERLLDRTSDGSRYWRADTDTTSSSMSRNA